jgi:hypothetical protein
MTSRTGKESEAMGKRWSDEHTSEREVWRRRGIAPTN